MDGAGQDWMLILGNSARMRWHFWLEAANMFANHCTALGVLFLTPSAPSRSSVHLVYLRSYMASLVQVTQTLLGGIWR